MEAQRQSEITQFLKNKPITSYEYSRKLKYEPEKADEFINNTMAEYETMSDKFDTRSVQYNTLKSRDKKALEEGLATLEDVEALEKDQSFFYIITSLSYMLNYTEEVHNIELKNSTIYGDRVPGWRGDAINYGIGTFWSSRPDTTNLGIYSNSAKDTFQDRKIDPETGETWILPFNSDKWVTRDDFIEMCPQYENSYAMNTEIFEVAKMGSEALFKYVEKYIAGLNDEEKAFIKENKLLSNPVHKDLGVAGLEEFAMDYTDYPRFMIRHTITDEDRKNIINGTYNDTILNLIPLDQIEEIRNNHKYRVAGENGIKLDTMENTGYVVDYDNYKQHSGQVVDSSGKPLPNSEKERISAFLKDKPFSKYQYEQMVKYVPLDASSFINNIMKSYDTERGGLLDGSYKELDNFTKSQGCLTSDDVARELAKQSFLMSASKINESLLYVNS